MKLVEGQITRLGTSVVRMNQGYRSYSMIQIGDKTLTDVLVDEKLNNFLEDGIAPNTDTKLWFLHGGKIIMAVQVGNQPRYYGTANPRYYLAAVLMFAIFPGLCLVIAFSNPPRSFVMLLPAAFFFAIWCFIYLRKILSYQKVASFGGQQV